MFRPFNRVLDLTTTGYAAVVKKAVAFWPVTLGVDALAAAATYPAVTTTPTGFLPEEDQGDFFIHVQLPESAKLGRTDDVLRRVEDIVLNSPGVESSIAVAGFSLLSQVNAPNAALCVVILKDWGERPDWPAQKLVETLGSVLGAIPDASVFAFNPPAIRGLGSAGGFEMQIRNEQGSLTPLGSFVTLESVVGPQNVVRYNLATSSTVNGSGKPGVSSGQVVEAVERIAADTLPAGMDFAWTGVTDQQQQAGNTAPIVFALAVVVVFLVLAAQDESWTIPLAILLAVPLGVLGAMLGLLARGMANDTYARIGLVLLVALVAKNAILLVEFAVQKRNEGEGIADSALNAARLRFRRILMTAFSFVLATSPLLIASGAGATSRRTLGTAVVAGMILATILGLVMTVFYVVFQRAKERFKPVENDDGGSAAEVSSPRG